MSINWPYVTVKEITLPPKGRACKNVHNISKSEDEDQSPLAKKSRGGDPDSLKVFEFVKKLECRAKSKYAQSKINFPKK